ncbi:hypothetical protein BJX64DRAFT_292174 [Aspergillus heterothallicus]
MSAICAVTGVDLTFGDFKAPDHEMIAIHGLRGEGISPEKSSIQLYNLKLLFNLAVSPRSAMGWSRLLAVVHENISSHMSAWGPALSHARLAWWPQAETTAYSLLDESVLAKSWRVRGGPRKGPIIEESETGDGEYSYHSQVVKGFAGKR